MVQTDLTVLRLMKAQTVKRRQVYTEPCLRAKCPGATNNLRFVWRLRLVDCALSGDITRPMAFCRAAYCVLHGNTAESATATT